MEPWQGLTDCLKETYGVVRVLKRTADKEIIVLQERASGRLVLLRNCPGEILPVYQILLGKSLPGIPRIYEVQPREGGFYVLEEFFEGRPLQPGAYSQAQIRTMLRQLCAALSGIHSLGIVHRDLKPDNILRLEDGSIRLLDFDAARIYKSHVEHDTCILGTTGFAAPEQFGILQTDRRADIFALGVTLNILLTGCHPTERLCRGRMRHVVMKCTRIDPRRRYQTARAVWMDVSGWKSMTAWGLSAAAAAALVTLSLYEPLPTAVPPETRPPAAVQETVLPQRQTVPEPEPRPGKDPAPDPAPEIAQPAAVPAARPQPAAEPEPIAVPAVQPEREPAPAEQPDPDVTPDPDPEPTETPDPDPGPTETPAPDPEPEVPQPGTDPAPQPEPKPAKPRPRNRAEVDTMESPEFCEAVKKHEEADQRRREAGEALETCQQQPYRQKYNALTAEAEQLHQDYCRKDADAAAAREQLEAAQASGDAAAIESAQQEYDRRQQQSEEAFNAYLEQGQEISAYSQTAEYKQGAVEEQRLKQEWKEADDASWEAYKETQRIGNAYVDAQMGITEETPAETPTEAP